MRRSEQDRRRSFNSWNSFSSHELHGFGQAQSSAGQWQPQSPDRADDPLSLADSALLFQRWPFTGWDDNANTIPHNADEHAMDTAYDPYDGEHLERLANPQSFDGQPMLASPVATPQKRKDRRPSDRMASPTPGRQRTSSPQSTTASTARRAPNGRPQQPPTNAQQARSSSRLTAGVPVRSPPRTARRGPLIDHPLPQPSVAPMFKTRSAMSKATSKKSAKSTVSTQDPDIILYYQLDDESGGNGPVSISHPSVQPIVHSRLDPLALKNQPSSSTQQPTRSSSQGSFAFRDPDLVHSFVPRSPANLSLGNASGKKTATTPANALSSKQPPRETKPSLGWTTSNGKAQLTPQASSSKPPIAPNKQQAITSSTSKRAATSKKPPKVPYLPFEIYELIAQHLSRTDIRNMRLVHKEFEEGISPLLFRSVVVPFNPQVYGRLGEPPGMLVRHGKQKANEPKPTSIDLDIFPGFGPHIRRFGMSFDLNLFALANPPTKNLQEGIVSFWGRYKWPFRYYRRFQDRAELEIAADETQVMKRAFAHLEKAQELGISLDCGLGWLNGPDLSVRAQILRQAPDLFGMMYSADANTINKRKVWQYIENHYLYYGSLDDLKEAELVRNLLDLGPVTQPTDLGPRYYLKDSLLVHEAACDSSLSDASLKTFWPGKKPYYGRSQIYRKGEPIMPYEPHVDEGADATETEHDMLVDHHLNILEHLDLEMADDQDRIAEAVSAVAATMEYDGSQTARGAIYIRSPTNDKTSVRQSTSTLTPKGLTMAQKEWMLETSWAQEAFLSSYMIAVTDNASTFSAIKKLTLARFSSKHLGKLCRTDFWKAFASLQELDLKVIADYRDVQKTEAGFANIVAVAPSAAVSSVLILLRDHVGQREKIQTLSVGWADGGEHAEGVSARNKLLLPAPIVPKQAVQAFPAASQSILSLPHVKHLELVNCWTTPNALEEFALRNRNQALRKVTLNSVSLTAHPKFGRNQAHNAPNAAAQAMNAQQPGQPPVGAAIVPAAVQALAQGAVNGALAPNHQALVQQHLAALQQATQQQGSSRRREGAWADIFDRLRTSLTQRGQTEFEMNLLSCGYTRLATPAFDQRVLDQAEAAISLSHPLPSSRSNFLTNKQSHLAGKMIDCSDGNLGSIVTALPNGEMDALATDWGCYAGWPKENLLPADYRDDDGWGRWGSKTVEGPEYDGGRRGGSGRFSGRITNWTALVDDETV